MRSVGVWLFAAALFGYGLGAFTVYGRLFPYNELKRLNEWVSGRSSISDDEAANMLFATFTPQVANVMIGDSLTANARWHDIFEGVKIANRGIGGNTTRDILRRIDAILALRPKKAFIEAGINDLLAGRSVDDTYSSYIEIVERLRRERVTVIIQSTIECATTICNRCTLRKVRALNKRLRAYASTQEIVFVDLNAGITDDEHGLQSSFTTDGIHLNGEGYLAWRKAIAPLIE